MMRAFGGKARFGGLRWLRVLLLNFCLLVSFAQPSQAMEVESESQFLVAGALLTNSAVEHSKTKWLRDWPGFFFAMPMVMQKWKFLQPFSEKPEDSKRMPAFAAFGEGMAQASLLGLGAGSEWGLQLTPLLKLSLGGALDTGFYYGSTSGVMGHYSPSERDYEGDYTFVHWGYRGFAKAQLALPVGLPFALLFHNDAFYRLFVAAEYAPHYLGYTGAKEGELWRNMGNGDSFEGWQHVMSAMLGFAAPFDPVKMLGVQVKRESYFEGTRIDPIYAKSGIDDVEWTVTMMAIMGFGERHSLMMMVPVKRYAHYDGDYLENEKPLLERHGHRWQLKVALLLYGYKF